jgi:hypothetical protein
MRRTWLKLAMALALSICGTQAQAVVLESWENPNDPTFDGWTIPTSENSNFSASYETSVGITHGVQSVKIALSNPNLLNPGDTATILVPGDPNTDPPTPPVYKTVYHSGDTLPNGAVASGPTYGQMLRSPSTTANTALFSHAGVVAIDINIPNTGPDFSIGPFDYYMQISAAINNNETTFKSLDNFNYSGGPNIGGQKTVYFQVPNSVAATLATSASPSELIFQIGGGYQANYNADGTLHQVSSDVMYVDNVRVLPKGDFNLDGELTNADIQAMLTAIDDPSFRSVNGLTSNNLAFNDPYIGIGDFNSDGLVDVQDIRGLLQTLAGNPVGAGSIAAVPEPSSGVLCVLAATGGLAVCGKRNRRDS